MHTTVVKEIQPRVYEIKNNTGLDWDAAAAGLLSERLGEPPNLRSQRFERLHQLSKVPTPHRFMESWRRTDPAIISQKRFKLWNPEDEILSETSTHDSDRSESPPVLTSAILSLCNAQQQSIVVEENAEDSGLVLASQDHAFRTQDTMSEFNSLIGRDIEEDDTPAFGLMNAVWYHGGYLLAVPRGSQILDPIWIRHRVNTPGHALMVQNNIKIGSESSLTVVIETESGGEIENYLNEITNIDLEPGAELSLIVINTGTSNSRYYSHLNVGQSESSNFEITWVDASEGWNVMRREVNLNGPYAEAFFRGMRIGSGEGSLELRTKQNHFAPATSSDLFYKSALFDNSSSIFRGLIRVEPEAAGTNAYQLNRNLLMDEGTKADAIPNLEILVDDVRCTHGVSTGKVNKDALFYMMSRGLNHSQAVNMLVSGFLTEAVDGLAEEDLKDYLFAKIEEGLSKFLGGKSVE